MLDFTSALYLGFEHPSWSLLDWGSLTLGKPAALEDVPGTLRVQRELAGLSGCERVILGSSTLHLFCDLFAMLTRRNVAIWIDEAAYPIARWATDRAAVNGVLVRTFPQHDAKALWRAVSGGRGARAVIVTDGYSPLRGAPAPLADYAKCAAVTNGLLVVDDTQALGILGADGGGSLRQWKPLGPGTVVVSSLSKALGVPVAMLGGDRALVERFREKSATVVHCSPPSAAVISAALRSLELNRRYGGELRRRLADRIARFRRGVPDLVEDGWFPVQPLALPGRIDVPALYRALLARGVRSVLHRDPGDRRARISFIVTARHGPGDIDRAVAILNDLTHERKQQLCHPDTREASMAERNRGAAVGGVFWAEPQG